MAIRRAILGVLGLAGLVCAPHLGVGPVAPPAAGPRAEAAPAKLDALGDPLPPGVLARMGTGRLRHGGVVYRVCFAPSGKLVSGGNDGTVRVWDGTSGKELLRLDAGRTGGRGLAVSRDGRLLAAGGDAAYVWDAATGNRLHRLPGSSGHTYGIAFSPDGGRLISTDGDHVFRLWDVASGQLVRTFSAEPTFIPDVAFSPDGKLLATSHARIVRLWDVATGEKLRALPDHDGHAYGLAFSPDGSTLATGSTDGLVRLWDAATGQLRRTLKGHKYQVLALAYSPGGTKLASAGDDNHVRVWDVATGAELLAIPQLPGVPRGNVNCVAFSPDGTTLAAGSNASRIRLWDAATGREKQPADGHEGHVTSMAFTPDGKGLISGCSGGTVIGWDAATGRRVGGAAAGFIAVAHGGFLAVAPGGELVCREGAVVVLRNPTTRAGLALFTLPLPEPPEREDLKGKRLSNWVRANCAAVSPDGKTVATACEAVLTNGFTGLGGISITHAEDIHFWDVATGRLVRTIALPVEGQLIRPRIDHLTFSPDGRTLAGGNTAFGHGTCRAIAFFWDVATGRQVLQITIPGAMHEYLVAGPVFSPDGKTVATGGPDTTTLVWALPRVITAAAGRVAPRGEP